MAEVEALALCSKEDVKDYLNITSSSDDNKIVEWINAVSDDCEHFCDRQFLKRTHTAEKYDGDNTDTLLLKQRPIVSVGSLVIEDGGTALGADEFYIYADQGKIVLDAKLFYLSRQKIVITYDAGYGGLASLPKSLRRAVVMGVVYRFEEMDKKVLGQTNISMGGGDQVITRTDDIYPKYVLSIWRRFKNHNLYVDGESR